MCNIQFSSLLTLTLLTCYLSLLTVFIKTKPRLESASNQRRRKIKSVQEGGDGDVNINYSGDDVYDLIIQGLQFSDVQEAIRLGNSMKEKALRVELRRIVNLVHEERSIKFHPKPNYFTNLHCGWYSFSCFYSNIYRRLYEIIL